MSSYFVHEKATCESTTIGKGTRIWGFSHVLAEAQIGENCNIGEGVFIENRVKIGNECTIKNGVSVWDCVSMADGVFVGPNAVFTNDFTPRAFLKRGMEHYLPTRLERGCTIGANATLVCGVTVGEFALVGAGSVVIHDVPPFSLVVGNPARVVGKVCYCGKKLLPDESCAKSTDSLCESATKSALALRSLSDTP